MRRIFPVWIVSLLLASTGCDQEVEPLTERLNQCRDLVEDRDPERRKASLDCFDQNSREILSRLIEQSEPLDYMGRYRKLLDFDEILADEVYDRIAVFLVRKGRSESRVVMVLEEGEWKIDALELRNFWRPLDEAGER
jgi:hypothetical protein